MNIAAAMFFAAPSLSVTDRFFILFTPPLGCFVSCWSSFLFIALWSSGLSVIVFMYSWSLILAVGVFI